MRRASLILAVSFVVTACSTNLYMPANRFMNPEASGGTFKGDFKLGGAGVTHVRLADDMTSPSPDTTPVLVKNSTMAMGLQLGLLGRLDGYYNVSFGGPGMAGAKLQLLGDTAEKAKSGNFSLAIAGGAATGTVNQTAGTEPSGKSEIIFGGYEGMVLIGYRLGDGALLYVTPSQTRVNAKVNVSRTSSGVTTTTAQPDGSGVIRAVGVGLRFGQSFFVDLEATGTETTWTREKPSTLESEKFNDTAVGVAVGGQW